MINTPDIEATKFWVGNLGKNATHALVFAQLYTDDNVCHGLHTFIVPVRTVMPALMFNKMFYHSFNTCIKVAFAMIAIQFKKESEKY